MKPVLLLFAALAITVSSPSLVCQAAKKPLVQDPKSHHYYTVKINDLTATSPQEIAQHLGVQYIGQVGELSQYHLFSYPKTLHEKRSEASPSYISSANATITVDGQYQDIVIRRYEDLKRSRAFHQQLLKRSSGDEESGHTDVHPLGPIQKQIPRRLVKRTIPIERRQENAPGQPQPKDGVAAHFHINDPGFGYQWHLHNTIQKGNDINVTGVWEQNITGKGVIVAIIDDGLDARSEDLAVNFYAEGSHDFNDNTDLPLPRLEEDNHGTRCAGEIASARNNLCGVGVAWDAKVAGIRILSGEITEAQEAEALNYGYDKTQIYSCSWGPSDNGIAMAGPTGILLDAFINGVNDGRQGKGSIFVFATGNGGRRGDNCNFDGYTNSRYTVSIGAITRSNEHPIYSEACSAQLAVTYSSGDNSWIYTCDVGKRNCYPYHSGTSAAAPIAAGIYALVLEVRPDLNWRDIQYLTVHTAIPVDEHDPDWTETYVGRLFNHKYGYGSLDAYKIVERAKTWVSVGPQVTYESPVIEVNGSIPSGVDDHSGQTGVIGLPSVFEVTEAALKDAKFGVLEHITVTVNIDHEFRGEVAVDLQSPNNIISNLAVARPYDNSTTGFMDWTFMTVKHWEEVPIGRWTLTVYDRTNPNNTGTFISWKLSLHGEIEGGHESTPIPTPLPLPPPAQPTTAPAIPEKTPTPGKNPDNSENNGDGATKITINPFIFVMFGGMFVAIGAALFLMYRQRTNPRSIFGSGINDDEEAGQRGGLLGRRGDYEFDELPTHDLGGSDDEDDDEDDRRDLDSHRIVFDRSNIVGSDHEQGAKEASHGQRGTSSPLSSGEEIEHESSFEVAVAEEEEEEEEDDFADHPGGSASKIKGDDWDELSTLVKTKDGRQA
ncbi:pheromone processing endoprotease [Haplosporangium sp. Z 767]|nr:pheromone processing endoprotease [Haplosporangium sp. Z 11]KAF9184544.1 pheromone processing endoprotease [Haplosporangium sp. Z 767]